VIFVNGLPLGVVELKNPADEDATVWKAVEQLENYQSFIPALFTYNAGLIASDGVQARIGALGAGKEWFKPWRTISGREDAAPGLPELQVVLAGAFEPRRFLDLVRHFIVFEDFGGGGVLAKKIAGHHQFHAVNVAIEETLRAANLAPGSRGGGRNLLRPPQPRRRARRQAGRRGLARAGLGQEPDDGVLCRTADPASGDGKPDHRRDHRPRRPIVRDFRALPRPVAVRPGTGREPGGFVREAATWLGRRRVHDNPEIHAGQKGDRHPVLSERRNIVVIADEAHRSQYDFIDGLARHLHDALPSASFIGFTGTPIEKTDANTRAVFGDYISIYDIQRAVVDGATVRFITRAGSPNSN